MLPELPHIRNTEPFPLPGKKGDSSVRGVLPTWVPGALENIAAGFPARVEELQRCAVLWRREASLEAARVYVLALEALVATALRAEVLNTAHEGLPGDG